MRLALLVVLGACLGCADVSRLEDFEFVDPPCEPEGVATSCFGIACGSVIDNCGEEVDCQVDCPGTSVCEVGGAPENTCGCTTGTAAPVPAAECLPPFGGPGGHAYYLCQKQGFEDARALCRSFGADLVIIADAVENAFVHGLIPGDGSNAHLGLWDPACSTPQGVPCNFSWIDGTPLSFTNWQINEPNNVGATESCVEIDDNGGGWNDVDCLATRHVICETTCP